MLRLDMRWGMAMAVMVLAMVEDASAELLLETDGIELRGTARVVTYEASLCNVEEASHTEEEYERIKANHGQPLDVWQLDFSVYNGSGKWLDHLIALYGIESKWPDCTNWSGDGPGGGPSGTYSGPVQWTGTAGHIQETGRNVVAPGATLTATTFILVFHEDPPPQFADWSVNFRFGKPVTAGGAETETPPASRAASTAGAVIDEILALQKEHELNLPDEFHFRYAKAADSTDLPEQALEAVVRYLEQAGREGEHYAEALELMNKAQAAIDARQEAAPGQPATTQPAIDDGRNSSSSQEGEAVSSCEQWNTEEFFRTATVEDVTACLAAGADVAARTEDGHTPLHQAAFVNENPAVVQALPGALVPHSESGNDRRRSEVQGNRHQQAAVEVGHRPRYAGRKPAQGSRLRPERRDTIAVGRGQSRRWGLAAGSHGFVQHQVLLEAVLLHVERRDTR